MQLYVLHGNLIKNNVMELDYVMKERENNIPFPAEGRIFLSFKASKPALGGPTSRLLSE
jgi:hypothetical protein